jgi:hypothetical protein
LASVLITVLYLISPGTCAAAYNFTVIASNGDTIDGYSLILDSSLFSLSAPAINNAGEVIFRAKYLGGQGIFSANRAIVVEGDTVAGRVLTSISGNPGVNAGGTVVYTGGFSAGHGIFTQSELLFSSGQVVGNLEITAFPQSNFYINDSGNVAVMARGIDVNTSLSSANVIDHFGTIAMPGDTIGGKTITEISQNPGAFVSINNADQVTFQATFDEKTGIFSRTDFLTSEGESVEGYVLDAMAAQTVINGEGDAVFVGVFCNKLPEQCPSPIRAAVMTQDQLLVAEGQIVGGDEIKGFLVSQSPAVSENGNLVFQGTSAAAEPGGGLYTPNGPVIRYMEEIAEQPVISFLIGPSGINNSGQIAFAAQFENSLEWAIIIADPINPDGFINISPVINLLLGE